MDIKDSYLHGTVGVVKSISVSADKLKYTLADIAGTVREVTLPVATTSANGLMSSGDKTKLDNLSSTIGNYVTLNTDQEITGTKTFTKQLKFTVAKGTAPFLVTSDTKVDNLNADQLDDYNANAFYNLYGGEQINASETNLIDLNNYKTPGTYYINTNKQTAFVSNLPVLGLAGILVINQPTGTSLYFRQQFTVYSGVLSYQRIYYVSDNIWTDWVLCVTDLDTYNAFSADKLKTKRKLWGLDFDGSADVSGDMAGVGSINMKGNIDIDCNNESDRFLVFNTGTTHNWRIGYLGSGSNNTNYLSFLSSKDTKGDWVNALTIGLINLDATFAGIVNAPIFQGNLDGAYVNKLTGYSKATSAADLAATDTLNTALGKLEYKAGIAYSWYRTITDDDTDDIINKWDEVVDFVNGLDTDLTDEFVTRKTDLTITGAKSFSTVVNITGTSNFSEGIRLHHCSNLSSLWFGAVNNSGYDPGMWGITVDANGMRFRGTNSTTGTSASDYVNIIYGGNVGIGTTNPSQKLHVNGNILATKFITSGGTSSQFVKGDGSLDSNTYVTTTSLGNYVTLNTNQVISGKKLFNNQLIIRKDVGDTGASVTDQQHNLLLQVMRYSDTHSVAIGVMPTGSGVIWAKANGIGYNTLYLNPHSKGVAIGCGDNTLPNLNDGYYLHIFGATLSNDNITANKFIKSGGTSSQFLKADGSVDSASYATTGSLGNYLPIVGGAMHKEAYISWGNTKADLYHDSVSDWSTINGYGLRIISNIIDPATSQAPSHYCTALHVRGSYGFQLACAGGDVNQFYIASLSNKDASGKRIWNTLLHSNNYTNYTVKKDGTGATGTWGINISGNANTSTTTTHVSAGAASNDVFRHVWFSHDPNETQRVYDDKFMYNPHTNVLTATVTNVLGGSASTNVNRHIWFSHANYETLRVSDDSFMYNPHTKVLTVGAISGSASKLGSTTIVSSKAFSLVNTQWIDVKDASNNVYTFANLASGTYAIQVTCGNLVASGIMSVYKNITDTALDEIPLHVYHDSSQPWRPYLRTSGNKLLISSNDATATSRTVTIKIALIL